MKIGFIGCGNMARAMIGGIIKGGVAAPEDICVSARSTESVDRAVSDFKVTGCNSNSEVAVASDVVIYAVKPQMYEAVIKETAGCFDDKKIAVSIAPGKSLEWMGKLFPAGTKIVRANPNTPAMVGEGITAYCGNEKVDADDKAVIKKILNSFGDSVEMGEHQMAGFISICGSSPAYVYMMIDAMADGGVLGGIPKATAIKLAAQAVLGSAKMVLETGEHPDLLKDQVCSPAGTTIEAVRTLEGMGFRSAIIEAEKACADRASSM